MTEDDIAKQMKGLIQKYSLPSFKDLDNEFEVGAVETPCSSLLSSVRNKMIERVGYFIKVLDDLLYRPDNSYANMHEVQGFSESERKSLFHLYKKLILLDRTSLELNLLLDEKQDADFIKRLFDVWQDVKPELLELVRKMKHVWENDETQDDTATYFT
ncbi:hypothetical protein COV93_06355 [Candidatus Woesearchaeota archaeon CG11_big_fil_rev_8_21_14_0_20_43_8]|nr:MAG: hypothetical protein COV93_06355 [Candidatus Woesearchaeota archaeon CG11_big_fil_rev_8_21_14_0_20_43_8]PIO04699.1 MAG: hypothetical protein COT47_07970 [Candidatus Woesearchaeota archaeon CG08_land_8_20_14_0_20_43_7]